MGRLGTSVLPTFLARSKHRDRNLQVAFMAMYVFLGMNGQRLTDPTDEPVPKLLRGVASNRPDPLATGIRKHSEER